MPELRLNLITREWVIMAPERSKRPDASKKEGHAREVPGFVETCPFCPGNERLTPPEIMRLEGDGNWRLRVFTNKFPALSPEGDKARKNLGVWWQVSGVGLHEVIVETPAHNLGLALLDAPQIEDMIGVYRERFIAAHNDPRVEHVIIFRNHGSGAGTSMEHPHSQLIATPVVPVQFRDRIQAAMHYFDITGNCLLCDMLLAEAASGERVIMESAHFLTFIPYAALSPFHIWIFPKRHNASFSEITWDEVGDLAVHLKTTLLKLHRGLGDPSYNYVIRSSRPKDRLNEFSHWYISIVPRVSQAAGFELGSGMYINSGLPEDNAEFLRTIEVAD